MQPSLESIFQLIPQGSERPEPTETENTAEQLRTLVKTLSYVEQMGRKPDRGETGDQPTVMLPHPLSVEAATGVVLHCSNRINSILMDDRRWEALASSQPLTKEEKNLMLERERLNIEREKIEIQKEIMTLKERELQLEINKKVSTIRIAQEKNKVAKEPCAPDPAPERTHAAHA